MPEGTVSSCHASLCSGKQRQWGVASAGTRPMRSRKGNWLNKGSSNKTAALMTELTQEEDFVVFLSSHAELQCSQWSNSHCRPETKHWWNIVTLLICLYCSQRSFHPSISISGAPFMFPFMNKWYWIRPHLKPQSIQPLADAGRSESSHWCTIKKQNTAE